MGGGKGGGKSRLTVFGFLNIHCLGVFRSERFSPLCVDGSVEDIKLRRTQMREIAGEVQLPSKSRASASLQRMN